MWQFPARQIYCISNYLDIIVLMYVSFSSEDNKLIVADLFICAASFKMHTAFYCVGFRSILNCISFKLEFTAFISI